MELRHLRYFVIVAEEQNVTRAAARLHVSQPPLSRQIQDLEAELGVALFQRTAKSLALTEAGKIFLTEAHAVLLRAEKAVQTVRAVATGNRGQLHVGYAPSLTVEILPKALVKFEQDRPGARVSLHDLSTCECIEKLVSGKLDVALTARPSAALMRGMDFDKLTSFPLFCAVGVVHSLANKKSIPIKLLQNERFISYTHEDYPEYHDWLVELFKPFHFQPHAAEEYDSATGLIAAVEAGRGVAIVTSSLQCLAGPRLKLLPVTPKLPPLLLGALRRRTVSPLTQQFIDAVRQSTNTTAR